MRYTQYDEKRGGYVLPLQKRVEDDRPLIKFSIGGDHEHAYGEIVDHLGKLENEAQELEKYKIINHLLERDIADREEMLEKKVEEVYPEFMRDYKCMREELEGLYDELEELRKEREARWKGAGMGDYYCSICQHQISGRTKFCPECGAKMDAWEEAEG